MKRSEFIAILSMVVFASLTRCAVDGRDPYALWNSYRHSNGDFGFSILSPPWDMVDSSNGEHFKFVLAPSLSCEFEDNTCRATWEAWSDTGDGAQRLVRARLVELVASGCQKKESCTSSCPFGTKGGVGFHVSCDDREIMERYYDIGEQTVIGGRLVIRDTLSPHDVRLLLDSFGPSVDTAQGEK